MKRQIIYPGAIPLETDLLGAQKNAMIAIGKLIAATFGTPTFASGLACVQTVVASLNVLVNPGEIYSLQNIDGTAYSSIAADTTHQIMKQGILLDAATLACAAPGTAGQSVNYLIQAAFSEVDGTPVVLPYYNASNPSQAYSGPANAGTTNNTTRDGQVLLSAKAGTAATTGSQTTPAPDAGYVGLWVVTVANGQTTIVAGNITPAVNAPILPGSLLASLQGNLANSATDTGTANTYVVSYAPAIAALKDQMVIWFNAKTANTGASTVAVNGIASVPLVGAAHSALQGGEIIANGRCMAIYNSTINSFVLMECTGGALQVSPGAQSGHAPNLGQFLGLFSLPGYLKIPVMVAGVLKNIIFQWGTAVTNASGVASLTLPIAFTTAVLGGTASYQTVGLNANIATYGSSTLTVATGYLATTAAAAVSGGTLSFIVIGW